MIWMALLGPALLSMTFSDRLGLATYRDRLGWIRQYGIRVFGISLLSQILITYVLRIDGVVEDSFRSFPFFIKYSLVAIVIAILLLMAEYLIKKILKISIEVGVYHENEEHEM